MFDVTNIDRGTVVKYSLLLILVVVVYFVVSKAIKKMKADQAAAALSSEIKSEELSYPLNQYVVFADKLAGILYPLNTDEEAVYSIFGKMNNLSDLLLLNKKYGLRAVGLKWDDYSLVDTLQMQMNTAEITKINKIIETKGINFSF